MCKQLIYLTLFVVLVLGLTGEQAWGQSRAAYWDGNYGTAWAGDGAGTRDALEAAGYEILDADQLKTWMDDHIPNGSGSVVVFCKDAVPDTVAETMSDTCTLRRYLDAGGKIVWQADIPFYYMTTASGALTTWADAGAPAILGFNTSSVTRDVGGSTITDEGIEWGITESWGSQRAANPDLVDIVLATDNNGNAAAWVKFYVPGDTGGGFVRIRDTGGQANVDDIMRVAEYGLGGNPFARAPEPKDGAMVAGTWANLAWIAGDFAVSHDVYMGDNFDDVNDGTRDSDVFRGNQGLGTEFYITGFAPYAYPDGLVPGTTYYWRIDEVNDANAASPWKGKVWSFWIPPQKAYEPVPSDGTKFTALDQVLSWTAGFGAKLHTIYFGDDYDTVANATSGVMSGTLNFNPGTLESDKMYYWRIDEYIDPTTTFTGDVWSFKTLPNIAVTDPNLVGWWKLEEGPGNIAIDWSGHGNHATLQGNPEWVEGYDGGALQCDGNGDWATTNLRPADFGLDGGNPKTVTAWVYTTGFNNGGIYDMGSQSDGQEFCLRTTGNVDEWRVQRWGYPTYDFDVVYPTENRWVHFAQVYENGLTILYANGVSIGTQSVALDTANTAFVIGRYGSGTSFNGIIDDVRIFNKALTEDEVKETMRGDPALAWNAKPGNGSTPYIKDATPLSWSPGENASQHDVYFGTDKNAVDNADTSDTTGIYQGRQSATTYTPPEGIEWGGGPYYWRIDQVNTDGTNSTGRIWTFTVADFIPIDDFEDYDAGDNQIWYSWIDGLGFGAIGSDPYHPGNGTGAAVGDETSPSYTEETIVHGGGKSMPLAYDNNKQGFAKYSETELTLTARRDWTEEGVAELSLWFRGYPGSVGSFVEGPVGTYTMTGSGADIWAVNGVEADEFHFAYKMLVGAGSIIARVDSVEDTNPWAKAGVMIRETLDPDSAHGFACVTPGNGVAAQGRPSTGGTSINTAEGGITAPHWVKLERSIAGSFTVSHSTNGSTWVPVSGATPQNVQMGANVYIGLAVTAHDAALTCQAVFSNVTTSGNVTGQWTNQDIGIESNDAEPLYVAVSNSTGTPAVVVHDDPAAAQIDTWTEWVIPLSAFSDQGIVLTNVDRIAIGLGTQGNMTVAGGKGNMIFDDLRLYRTREAAE